jgi:hypothetical protein
MKSWMRMTLIILIIVATIARLLGIWSGIDPVVLTQITWSVWAIGIATVLIGYLSEEHKSPKDQY